MSVRTPLVDPSDYFARDERRIRGTHIVALVVVGNVVVDFLLLQITAITSNFTLQEHAALLVFSLIIAPIMYTLVHGAVWVIFAVTMHFLSGGKNSAATIKDALDVTGWAFAPHVLEMLIMIPIASYAISQYDVDAENLSTYQADIYHPVAIISTIDQIVFITILAWGVYILVYGFATTHDVSPRRTLVPAVLIGILVYASRGLPSV